MTTVRLGACSQDLTYLEEYRSTTNGHTFKYHCKFFSVDEYEIESSGKKFVPVREEQEVEDVKSHCDTIRSKVDDAMVESCGGSECKARVSRRPPRRSDILLMAVVVRCAGFAGLDERCLVSIGERERTVGSLGSEINKSDGSVQQDRCIFFRYMTEVCYRGYLAGT